MTLLLPAFPFRRPEWIGLVLLFLLAFGTRAELLHADYFSDEPMSYALSRHLFEAPPEVRDVDGVQSWHYPRSWYLERPGFYLLMTPAGWISFTAYRTEYIAIAALLAPLGARLLRAWDVRPVFAYSAGALVAIHPEFVQWGSITHMDTPMTVALAAAFLSDRLERHRLAAFFFMWAVWTKQTALPFLLFVFAARLALDAFSGRRIPWPIRFTPGQSAMFTGILLGFIPFLLAQEMGFGLPGERATGRSLYILDAAFLSVWFLPLIIANLGSRSTRDLSLWALALPLFYLALQNFFGWNTREWYMIASAFFAVLASAACLDRWWNATRIRAPNLRPLPLTACAVVLVLVTALVFADDSPQKREYAHPLYDWASPSLQQKLEQQLSRDLHGRAMLAAIEASRAQRVLLIDVHYAFAFHPLPDYAEQIRVTHTFEFHGNPDLVRAVVTAAEGFAELTVVQKRDGEANELLRMIYADCQIAEGEMYVFLDIAGCPGRFERLYRGIAGAPEATP